MAGTKDALAALLPPGETPKCSAWDSLSDKERAAIDAIVSGASQEAAGVAVGEGRRWIQHRLNKAAFALALRERHIQSTSDARMAFMRTLGTIAARAQHMIDTEWDTMEVKDRIHLIRAYLPLLSDPMLREGKTTVNKTLNINETVNLEQWKRGRASLVRHGVTEILEATDAEIAASCDDDDDDCGAGTIEDDGATTEKPAVAGEN